MERLREEISQLENCLETSANNAAQAEEEFCSRKQEFEDEIVHLLDEIEELKKVLGEKEESLASVCIEKDDLIAEVFLILGKEGGRKKERKKGIAN